MATDRQTVQVDTASKTGKNVTSVSSTTLSVTVADKPNRCLTMCFGDSNNRIFPKVNSVY